VASSVKRSYDNDRRTAQSQDTKQRILEAARQLLMAKGYRATTVAQVARAAGVHHDTIYALVGRKPEILRELIEMAISGADGPVAPEEREYVQRMLAEPDPRRKLAIYASAMQAIQTRMAPLLLALRDASSTEPEAEQVWKRSASGALPTCAASSPTSARAYFAQSSPMTPPPTSSGRQPAQRSSSS
jgi:AcrR family transcriptional regulator